MTDAIRPQIGGLKAHYPWSIACTFGTIECGPGEDRWRQIWNGRPGAEAWAEFKNGFSFGRHVFAVPLPCPGDQNNTKAPQTKIAIVGRDGAQRRADTDHAHTLNRLSPWGWCLKHDYGSTEDVGCSEHTPKEKADD